MINRYVIYEQYEFWGPEGKQWTNWFRTGQFHKTEEFAKEAMNKLKETIKSIDSVSKLKHKFEVRLIDIETLPIPKLHYRKKGRPSKEEKERLKHEQENYWKLHEHEC